MGVEILVNLFYTAFFSNNAQWTEIHYAGNKKDKP